VQQKKFSEVPKRLQEGSMVNLNAPNPAAAMKQLLQTQYYFEDQRDIDFISATIAKGFSDGEGIDNIGDLNKKSFFVNADEAFAKGGESFKKRVRLSRNLVGFNDEDSVLYEEELRRPQNLPAQTDVAMGGRFSVSGEVKNNGQPAAGVLIKLQMVVTLDSLYGNDETEGREIIVERAGPLKRFFSTDSAGKKKLKTFFAYARTDANGNFSFIHLPEGSQPDLFL